MGDDDKKAGVIKDYLAYMIAETACAFKAAEERSVEAQQRKYHESATADYAANIELDRAVNAAKAEACVALVTLLRLVDDYKDLDD